MRVTIFPMDALLPGCTVQYYGKNKKISTILKSKRSKIFRTY